MVIGGKKKEDSNDQVAAWRALIEQELREVSGLCGATTAKSSLHQASDYVLTGGGKRLRALLTCSVWWDLSEPHERGVCRAIAPAVALEVLHAASLVHDDLPALDNDDMRRGRPSCHKAHGEATAILTGDVLIGAAILRVASSTELSSDEHARLNKILAKAWVDLCAGQQLDLHCQTSSGAGTTSSEVRRNMIRLKTGALFGAAVECGALCAGVRDSALFSFRDWGIRVGECFQAIDDLDDGDRPRSDGDVIKGECQQVQHEAEALHPSLTTGITSSVVRMVLQIPA